MTTALPRTPSLRLDHRRAQVTGAVLFVATNAAALVTGSALMVNGGWTAS